MKASNSKSQRVNFEETFDRNFITQRGALKEFLLKPSQLEGLPQNIRRSPYETEVSMVVYNRKDVEARAKEVWNSLDDMDKVKKVPQLYRQISEEYNNEVKKTLRDARNPPKVFATALKKRSIEIVIITIALFIDLLNFVFKLVIWYSSNSDSILAEAIHSAADTINQTILVIGLCQTTQKANQRHPYGYANMMYVVALISGVGIFCLGAAVSLFNGILTLSVKYHSLVFTDIKWAFIVLTFSAFTEAIGLTCSIIASFKDAKTRKTRLMNYICSGLQPGIIVILLEDFVAVLGNIVAGVMLLTSWRTGNCIPDAVGCVIIGLLLGVVALFLIVTNAAALVGRSIPPHRLEEINRVLESDVMIRAIHDVKGIDMGNNLVRYKAEIDIDGAELTRLYLDHINIEEMLVEVNKINSTESLELFMLHHGENIVDLVGGQIDRIELNLRKRFSEIRHVDLEIL